VTRRVRAQRAERIDQRGHGDRRIVKIADLHMMRAERLRHFQQPVPAPVGPRLALIGHKPVLDELYLECRHPMIVEDTLHLRERTRLENMLEVGVPEAHPAETCIGSRFHAPLEIERADLGLHRIWPGGGPEQVHELWPCQFVLHGLRPPYHRN